MFVICSVNVQMFVFGGLPANILFFGLRHNLNKKTFYELSRNINIWLVFSVND